MGKCGPLAVAQPLQRLDWGLGLSSCCSTVLNGALGVGDVSQVRTYHSMALEGDAPPSADRCVHLGGGGARSGAGPSQRLVVARPTRWRGRGAEHLVARRRAAVARLARTDGHCLGPEQLAQIDAVLQAQTQAAQLQTGEHLVFDSLHTRQAGGHSFIDLHLHVPGEWTLAQAADWRQRTEAALMAAIPRVQARIELLPQVPRRCWKQKWAPSASVGPQR